MSDATGAGSAAAGARSALPELIARCQRAGGETLLGDKGYAGRDFADAVSELDATIVRPRRRDEAGHDPHLAPIPQRIESIFWTCKDLLTLRLVTARREGLEKPLPPTPGSPCVAVKSSD